MRYLFEDYTLNTDRRELHRGADDRLCHATSIRFARLPDPQQRARRQQGRPHQRHLERPHRFRCGADNTLERRPELRSAIPARNSASSKHCRARDSVSSDSAGSARDRKRAVAGEPLEPPKPALTLPDKPSIAVLPFANLSSDPEQEYFADGMVDEITTALSRFKLMFVIARNTSFTYKGRAVDIKQDRARTWCSLRARGKRAQGCWKIAHLRPID